MIRKEKFVAGEIFHIFNKSIASFGIFKDLTNSQRFIEVLDYYNNIEIRLCFSDFLNINKKYSYESLLKLKNSSWVKFLAYCIMPDHYHLLIKVLVSNSISHYLNTVENSFSRYFNLKFDRKGPLWQSTFKAVKIVSNEQLLHISRYIHLNPTTNNLVQNPQDWIFSSYSEFINDKEILRTTINEISIQTPKHYQAFVENRKDYQRRLKEIRNLLHD